MKILGINQVSGLLTWQHDGAAALVVDGKIIASAEEERFNRVRHAKGMPRLAIEYCLKEGSIEKKNLDVIAVGYNPWAFLMRGHFQLSLRDVFTKISTIFIFHAQLKQLAKETGAQIMYIDHHRAHAASAYRCSGFENANILTIDGAGETESFTFFTGKKGVIEKMYDMPIARLTDTKSWRSIGMIYTAMTAFLKLGAHGEGKTMGLASYGTPKYDFSHILHVKNHKEYQIDRRNIKELYGNLERKDSNAPLTQEHKDLAASLQHALEESIVNLAKEAFKETGIRNFALAGGVTLNCNTNTKLLEQDFCDVLFIQPAANDGGIALGAALEAMSVVGDAHKTNFPNAYWGPGFTNEDIEKILKEAKVSYRKSDNIASDAADLVTSGKIVGWFQGRMETGPRALGNRSILADPTKEGINDKVNIEIKHREVWRPFAPSVAEDAAAAYFEGVDKAHESPYMLHTFYVREKYRSLLPAITHIDGSSRIQTVSRDQNERYYMLLKEIEKRNGHPIVLNTSFNDAGEPIVCSPKDALRCYFSTGFDALAIGDFLLEKRTHA